MCGKMTPLLSFLLALSVGLPATYGQTGHLTEEFLGDGDWFDLAYASVTFTPISGGTSYACSLESITHLPTNPALGTNLPLGDDDWIEVEFVDPPVSLRIFNRSFSTIFVGSNGYVTFTRPDTDPSQTLDEHFEILRISGLYCDLAPHHGGSVKAQYCANCVAVTWQGVPEYENTAPNTFQIVMFFDGRIQLSWLEIGARECIVGLSNGGGLSRYFRETDFTDCPGEPRDGGGVKAEYFEGMVPQGNPCLTRIEPRIDNDWGTNVVACGLRNRVSARWTATLDISTRGTYTFATNSDDGVLLWLNGLPIIENWTDHPSTFEISQPWQLEPGRYSLCMEWYENAVDAVAELYWARPGRDYEIIPSGSLQPPPPPIPPPEGGPPRAVPSLVEGFDHFNDDVAAGRAIFQTWIGGRHPVDPLYDNGTGMRVGHLTAPYAEQTIVYSGRQSMPLYYDNSHPRGYSQADRTWDTPQNWQAQGDTLSLQVHGQPPKLIRTDAPGYIISGAGEDIWGTSDEFRFMHRRIGNVSEYAIHARVVSNGQGSNAWAKGGVMIRESLDPGSKHAMTVVTGGAGGGGAFQWRRTTNGVSYSSHNPQPPVSPPHWVKIERIGNNFSAYLSPDGVNWTQQGQTQTIYMNSEVYIGMCVTSHASGELRTYEFDNVYVHATIPPYGETGIEDVGVAQPGNDPAQLYIEVEDVQGRVGEVIHPDPDILLRAEWTEWRIPLSRFAQRGVNLVAVERMSIGMRDLSDLPGIGIGLMQSDDSGSEGTGPFDWFEFEVNPDFPEKRVQSDDSHSKGKEVADGFQLITAGTSRGLVSGMVESSGGTIDNAKVTLTRCGEGGGASQSKHTENGYYFFRPPVGWSYSLSVEAKGFKPQVEPGLLTFSDGSPPKERNFNLKPIGAP